MIKQKNNKIKTKKSGTELRFSSLIKRLSAVSCPDCGKPVWLDLVGQLKKIKKIISSISLKNDVKEEAVEFFIDVVEAAESYYLNKFSKHHYQITEVEESVLEKFQKRKEIKNIVNESVIEILEEFPVIADWMAIPDSYLPFGQKKALLLILRKVKK